MQFMQRKAEADAAKRELDGPGDQAPSEAEHGGGGVRKVTVVDGVGNPVIKYCPGRRSFLRSASPIHPLSRFDPQVEPLWGF